MQIQRSDDICIVQRRTLHGRPRNMHRLQIRDRRHIARPSDLIRHINQQGFFAFCLKFISNRPTGRFCRVAQQMLHLYVIHLDNNPVNGHGQVCPLFVPLRDKSPDFFHRIRQLHIRRHVEPPFLCLHQIPIMRSRRRLFSGKVIQVTIQMAFGDQRRILQFQRAGSRIPWIGKQRLSCLRLFLVQAVKDFKRHQDFTAYLKFGWIIPPQFQRHGTDSPHIGSHIVPAHPVPPGNCLRQRPIDVCEANGSPVIFQFTNVLHLFSHYFPHPLVEILQFLPAVSVPERKHRIFMRHLPKLTVNVLPHPLCGGIGVIQFRMQLLQPLQLMHQPVKFLIGNLRSIINIIPVVMILQQTPQF